MPPGAPEAGQVGMEWPWWMSALGRSSKKPGIRLLCGPMAQGGPTEGKESQAPHIYYGVLRQKLEELQIKLQIFSLMNFIPVDLPARILFYNS